MVRPGFDAINYTVLERCFRLASPYHTRPACASMSVDEDRNRNNALAPTGATPMRYRHQFPSAVRRIVYDASAGMTSNRTTSPAGVEISRMAIPSD